MRAHVKVNVSIHLEPDDVPDEKVREEIKYPLAANYAGVVAVKDKDEAVRVIEMLGNHVKTTFKQMSVAEIVYGSHKPDLALAKGGDPEPTVLEAILEEAAKEKT